MGCPKNPKKFLRFFSYEGAHDLRLVQLEYYGTAATLQFECERCGSREEKYLRDEELVRRGFDVKKLREAAKAMVTDAKMPKFLDDLLDEYRQSPRKS